LRRRTGSAALLTGLLLSSLFAGGCISLAKSEIGSAPEPATVAQLRKGVTFEEVVEICGVPMETIYQREGILLIYRERHYRFKRFGFDPGLVAGLVDITGLVRTAVANLKLILEWGRVEERRLVVLFDRDDRVAAIAYRDVEDDG
jgi:hypothetical protein